MKERKKIEHNDTYDISSTNMHIQVISSFSSLMCQIVGGIINKGFCCKMNTISIPIYSEEYKNAIQK